MNKFHYTLAYAVECLEKTLKKPIVFIEYEDGSGKTFNYRLVGVKQKIDSLDFFNQDIINTH